METQNLKFTKRVKPEVKRVTEKSYLKLSQHRKRDRSGADADIRNILKELNRLSKTTLGRKELKIYAQLLGENKIACENERMKFLGKNKNMPGIIRRHKTAFRKEVERNIPGLIKLLKMRSRLISGHIEGRNKFSGTRGMVTGIMAGRIEHLLEAVFLDPTAVNNTPPYAFSENRIDIIFDEFSSLQYDSVADADSGLIIHNITSYHEDNAWFTHKAAKYEAFAGFGVNYTMPKTGIVSVDVFIQNLYNKNSVSITDNTGLSEGWANLENKLYMNILHPNNIVPFEIELNRMNLHSDGDDLIKTDIGKIDTEFAKWINFRSTGSFVAGTELQIIIGNKETFYNILDDMQCSSDTLYSWFVRNIIVRTA